MPRSKTKPRVLLYEMADTPIGRDLRAIVPVPEALRHVVYYACFDQHSQTSEILEAIPEPSHDERVISDLLAMSEAASKPFAGDLFDDGACREMTHGFHPGLSVAAAKELLEERCDVVLYADIVGARPVPETDDAALSRAEGALAELGSRGASEAILTFLRGATDEPPARVRDLNRALVASICTRALGGDVERWSPAVSGRILDLWMVVREPWQVLELDAGSWAPHVDRASLLTDQLERRGVNPAIGFLSGGSWPSRELRNAVRMADFDALLAAAREIDERTPRKRDRISGRVFGALFDVGKDLGAVPTLQDLARKNLERGRAPDGAITASGLRIALDSFGSALAASVTRSHLERAKQHDERGGGCSVLALAAKLAELSPETHEDTPRYASELWLGSTDAFNPPFADMLIRLASEAFQHVDRIEEIPSEEVIEKSFTLVHLKDSGWVFSPEEGLGAIWSAYGARSERDAARVLTGVFERFESFDLPSDVPAISSLVGALTKALWDDRERAVRPHFEGAFRSSGRARGAFDLIERLSLLPPGRLGDGSAQPAGLLVDIFRLLGKAPLSAEERVRAARLMTELSMRHPAPGWVYEFDLLARTGEAAAPTIARLITRALATSADVSIEVAAVRASRDEVLRARREKFNETNILFAGYVARLTRALVELDGEAPIRALGEEAEGWTDEMLWVFLEVGVLEGGPAKMKDLKASEKKKRILRALHRPGASASSGSGVERLLQLLKVVGEKLPVAPRPRSKLPAKLPTDTSRAFDLCDRLELPAALLPRGAPATESDLTAAEEALGAKLPPPLVELLRRHDGVGASEIVSCRSLAEARRSFFRCATSHLEEGRCEDPVAEDDALDLRDLLPLEGLVVIGQTVDADFLFLDPRRSTKAGTLPVLCLVHDEMLTCHPHQPSLGRLVAELAVDALRRRDGDTEATERLLERKSFRVFRSFLATPPRGAARG